MKVDFVGTLAQAQKKYHTMGGLANAIQTAAPIMQMYPNSADFIEADELFKTVEKIRAGRRFSRIASRYGNGNREKQ